MIRRESAFTIPENKQKWKGGQTYMIFMKIIGCIMVVGSTSGMGFFFSNEMRCRIGNLKELRKLIGLLRGDIRYANTPLPEAIASITRRHKGSFDIFLNSVSTKLQELSGQTFAEVWKEAVNKELLDTSLSKKDKLHLIQFGENLGYLDKDMQMNVIDLFLSQLEEEIKEMTKAMKEKSYLYNSLGIMAGVFIVIVMI